MLLRWANDARNSNVRSCAFQVIKQERRDIEDRDDESADRQTERKVETEEKRLLLSRTAGKGRVIADNFWHLPNPSERNGASRVSERRTEKPPDERCRAEGRVCVVYAGLVWGSQKWPAAEPRVTRLFSAPLADSPLANAVCRVFAGARSLERGRRAGERCPRHRGARAPGREATSPRRRDGEKTSVNNFLKTITFRCHLDIPFFCK